MVNTAPVCADGCGRRVLESSALVRFARDLLGIELRFPRRRADGRLVCSACHARGRVHATGAEGDGAQGT